MLFLRELSDGALYGGFLALWFAYPPGFRLALSSNRWHEPSLFDFLNYLQIEHRTRLSPKVKINPQAQISVYLPPHQKTIPQLI